MLIDDQSALIAALSSPEAFGLKSSQKITVKETNISDVFLTGEKAYKLKRGVKYPYVDYSTPEKRLAACQKELDICNRFAPGLCFGVEEVVIDKKAGSSFVRPVRIKTRKLLTICLWRMNLKKTCCLTTWWTEGNWTALK